MRLAAFLEKFESGVHLLVVFGFLVLIQVGVVQAYVVPTGSMEDTILAGELVLADKITLGPRTPQWVGIPWTKTGFHVPAIKLPGLRGVADGIVGWRGTGIQRPAAHHGRSPAAGEHGERHRRRARHGANNGGTKREMQHVRSAHFAADPTPAARFRAVIATMAALEVRSHFCPPEVLRS
jgi:hypothetical protein